MNQRDETNALFTPNGASISGKQKLCFTITEPLFCCANKNKAPLF